MKKIIVLIMIITFSFVLAACSSSKDNLDKGNIKNLNCTLNEAGDDDLTVDYKIKYTFNNGVIKKLESTSIIEVDPELLENIITNSKSIIGQMALYEGFTYEVTKEDDSHISGHVEIDYTKIDADSLREQYGDDYVDSDTYLAYTSMTMEDVNTSMTTAGYSCK